MSRKDPLLSGTEAQGPGDAGPRTFSLERREPDKSQASGFPILDSGIPFHLSTELDPQSKETPWCTAAEVSVCVWRHLPARLRMAAEYRLATN